MAAAENGAKSLGVSALVDAIEERKWDKALEMVGLAANSLEAAGKLDPFLVGAAFP